MQPRGTDTLSEMNNMSMEFYQKNLDLRPVSSPEDTKQKHSRIS